MLRKKALAALLAALTIFTAVGCKPTNQENSSSSSNSVSVETDGSISGDSTPEIPDGSTPENSTPESSSPDSTVPENSSPNGSAPSDPSVPDDAPPADSTPSDSVPETPPAPSAQEYIRCTGDNVNIRSGAGTSFTVLGQAEKGTMYAITGKVGNWYQTYYRGKTAYVYMEYAAVFSIPLSDNEQVEEVISEGYKHIGVPYVYGAVRLHDGKGNFLKGFTAQQFDCSSLVQYVYYQAAGKLLDVTTRTQVKQGKFVPGNDLQRGDCIYFTNESRQHLTGIERVGHVAIYLGNNYILHTASDYARIEKMSQQRWDYYLEARRFV